MAALLRDPGRQVIRPRWEEPPGPPADSSPAHDPVAAGADASALGSMELGGLLVA